MIILMSMCINSRIVKCGVGDICLYVCISDNVSNNERKAASLPIACALLIYICNMNRIDIIYAVSKLYLLIDSDVNRCLALFPYCMYTDAATDTSSRRSVFLSTVATTPEALLHRYSCSINILIHFI